MDIRNKKYTVRKYLSRISKMGEELVIEIGNARIGPDMTGGREHSDIQYAIPQYYTGCSSLYKKMWWKPRGARIVVNTVFLQRRILPNGMTTVLFN